MSSSTGTASRTNASEMLHRRPIKKPTRPARVNEEDEFSPERFIKALIITVLTISLIVGFFYHVSVVIDIIYQSRAGFIQSFFVGILGLVVNLSLSVKVVRFLNKVMFIKEDEDLEKKYI